jgi:xanthine dehydrogenase accessory factor
MTQTADRISELRTKGGRAAVATLIATTGGAIRRLGETMWVDEHGAIVGSVTIGGCVDARAIDLAEEVLKTGASRRVSLPLGDEDAWAFGMTCAGNVELLVERVDVNDTADPVSAASGTVAQALQRGCSALEAVSLGTRSQRLVVLTDGTRIGTLGSAMLDDSVAARAPSFIDRQMTGVVAVERDDDTEDIFIRVHAPLPSLIVVGATDVAVSLVQLAKPLGFNTTVIDGRERFANRERFPGADAVTVGMPSEVIAGLPLVPSAALVLLSHDFKYDLPVLEVALRSRVGYIGVLGSQRRAAAIREFLAEIGASADDIARVRIPVGIDIGARAPAEIALSVLAELIALRGGRDRRRDA